MTKTGCFSQRFHQIGKWLVYMHFCCFWIRFVTLTYPILALFEILLFLDMFCNTNVSDYRTGEFGLSAWTLSLLLYLEKSIYQNSRVKSRALSRASAEHRLRIQHLEFSFFCCEERHDLVALSSAEILLYPRILYFITGFCKICCKLLLCFCTLNKSGNKYFGASFF